jgi:hypothetical protein
VPQYLEAFSGEVHQNSIHPIQRGAGHQADVEITHGCGVWLIPPLAVCRRGEYFYWALACWIRSAEDSWVRMAAAKRWKAAAPPQRPVLLPRFAGRWFVGPGAAVDAELEVQVRPGGPARGAHGTDGVALFHRLAILDVDAAQVGIHGVCWLRCLTKTTLP